MIHRLILCLFFLLPFSAPAQPADTVVFAYVQQTKGRFGRPVTDNYKVETARAVYRRLVQAQGDLRRPVPELVLYDGRRYVAWMNADGLQIGLEEQAYDVCASMGADSLDALAMLLAHELMHYYQDHDWKRHFVHQHTDLDAARQLDSLEEGLKQETQADHLGGFLALTAGFKPFGILPRLLPKLYERYNLPPDIYGYPSLQERLALAMTASERVQDLAVVLETAQCLTLLEAEEAALPYYRNVLREYQGREVYNNAAVAVILAALRYFSPQEMPYVLPVELDARSRLDGLRDPRSDVVAHREELLREAIDYLERATLLDKHYAPAALNLAVVHLLLNDTEESEFWLRRCRKAAPEPKTAGDAEALAGVLAAVQEDPETARMHWRKAAAEGSTAAGHNLEKGTPTPNQNVLGFARTVEYIDSLQLDDYLKRPAPKREVKVDRTLTCGVQQMPGSQIYIHYDNRPEGLRYAVFQWTEPAYSGTTGRGLPLGAPAEQIAEHYGDPTRTLELTNGAVLHYSQQNLLLQLDRQGRLVRWAVYRHNLPRPAAK